MATYVLGDIHGCRATLDQLLSRIPFREGEDHLWLTGDLVNRGPASLEVLRWARGRADALGPRFATVLGNHDLHLLARHYGVAEAKDGDTLEEVLAAPDREGLLRWLQHRPLLHRVGNTLLVHAGLRPEWTAVEAERLARRLEGALRSPTAPRLLNRKPTSPRDALPHLRRALHGFTLLRTLTAEGGPCKFSGPPDEAPEGCLPWFDHPERKRQQRQQNQQSQQNQPVRVIFGHWAALGFHRGDGVLGLDSGCVWGNALTAVRLEDGERFSVLTVEEDRPR